MWQRPTDSFLLSAGLVLARERPVQMTTLLDVVAGRRIVEVDVDDPEFVSKDSYYGEVAYLRTSLRDLGITHTFEETSSAFHFIKEELHNNPEFFAAILEGVAK